MIYDYYEDPYHEGEEDKGSGKVLLLFLSVLMLLLTGVGFSIYALFQFLR